MSMIIEHVLYRTYVYIYIYSGRLLPVLDNIPNTHIEWEKFLLRYTSTAYDLRQNSSCAATYSKAATLSLPSIYLCSAIVTSYQCSYEWHQTLLNPPKNYARQGVELFINSFLFPWLRQTHRCACMYMFLELIS